MIKLIHYSFYLVLLFILSHFNLNAQVIQSFNNYHLRLDQGAVTATTYEVIINVATDPTNGARRLGSSNFQILFSNQFLANPTLSSSSLTAAYDQASITQPTDDKVSFNVSLLPLSIGFGMPISVFPAFTEVGRIVFDITIPGSGSFIWTDNVFDTKETVVYYDDEGILRHPVQMTDLQNTTFDLDLQSFEASWKNENENDAIVHWITATEDGTTLFEVERSFDGIDHWEKVGSMNPKGGISFGAEYSFEDTQVSFYMPDLLVYYRLKEISASGMPSFSDTRVLQRTVPKERNFIAAYPNPVDDELIVDFNINGFNSGAIELFIVSADGRKVYETSFAQNEPRNIMIETDDFAPGVYAVFVRQGTESIVQKFVKRSKL